jgi:hypothetical protein
MRIHHFCRRSGTLVWFKRTHRKQLVASWYVSESLTHSSDILGRLYASSLMVETPASQNVIPPA